MFYLHQRCRTFQDLLHLTDTRSHVANPALFQKHLQLEIGYPILVGNILVHCNDSL